MHGFGLSDSMWPILSLFVHCWIPVSVVKDDTICACQVDADSSASSWGDKAENFEVKVEPVHHFLTGLYTDWTIQTNIGIAMQVQKSLKYVKHPGHLSENQHFRAFDI